MKKIVIIGGGIAGLTAGIYAKLKGYDAEIFEKNHEAGGFLTSWYRDGNLVDGCLHWMVGTKDGTALNGVWKRVGGLENTEIVHPNSFFEVICSEERVVFYRDVDRLQAELLRHAASDGDRTLVNALVDAIKETGVAVVPSEVPFELVKEAPPLNMALMRKLRPFLNKNVEDLANAFDSEILRFAFRNAPVDRHFSAHYLLQTLSNFAIGNASLPLEGSHAVRDKLVKKFLSLGGNIRYLSPVEEIVVNNGRAEGVLSGGTFYPADYVVPACDLHYVFERLLKGKFGDPYAEFDEKKEDYPTYSFIIASYKTKRDFSKDEIASVYKVEPYSLFERTYDVMSVRHFGYNENFVNDGYTTVSVMLPTYEEDYELLKGLTKEEYRAFKEEFSALYKRRLEAIYGEEFLLIDSLTPLTYERFVHSYKGSFMTYAIGAKKKQGLRSALVEGIDNLVLANQWLVMPGGTPIALVSGKFALQHILNKDGRDYHVD